MTGEPSLLIVAHGASEGVRARRPALDHANRIRESGEFDEVFAGFLHGDPSVSDCLALIQAERIVVVPLFVSDGYFAGEVLPARIEAGCPESVAVTYASPIGTHDRTSDVISERATSAVDDPDGTGLALIGHGSQRASANRETVRGHAACLRERTDFAAVRSFFLEEEPTVEQVPTAFDVSTVVAVPVFVAKGHHVREDIPERLGIDGDDGKGSRVTYTDPIGTHPTIADIVRDRAKDALDAGRSNRPRVTPPGGDARERSGRNTT